MSEMVVKTNDIVLLRDKLYEIVIADSKYFVACPIGSYNEGFRANLQKAEIYTNIIGVNTAKDLNLVTQTT